jgi:enamine deaminase RidA (YjgF/YER057c/UK114 family)
MVDSKPRRAINPPTLSAPTGSPETPFYSWVVTRGNFITLSGMSPYDKDKNLIGTDLRTQTEQAFRNLKSALEAVDATLDDVCSITVYVQATDLQKDVYPHINPAGFEAFGATPPARTVIGGVALPRPSELVLISAIAIRETGDR